MGFSADPVGAELVAVVVAEGAVVGSVVDEQLAIKRATQAASPAMRVGRALRERRPSSPALSTFSAWETLIVDITASAAGFACPADARYTLGRRRMRSRKLSLSAAAYISVQVIYVCPFLRTACSRQSKLLRCQRSRAEADEYDGFEYGELPVKSPYLYRVAWHRISPPQHRLFRGLAKRVNEVAEVRRRMGGCA